MSTGSASAWCGASMGHRGRHRVCWRRYFFNGECFRPALRPKWANGIDIELADRFYWSGHCSFVLVVCDSVSGAPAAKCFVGMPCLALLLKFVNAQLDIETQLCWSRGNFRRRASQWSAYSSLSKVELPRFGLGYRQLGSVRAHLHGLRVTRP